MIHEILESDVEVARELINSSRPDTEIVAALAARGIETAKATRLLDDLHHGRKPVVEMLVVPRPSGAGTVGRREASRGNAAPNEKHTHGSRSRSSEHHRAGIPWWFILLILIFLGAFIYAFLETGNHAASDAVDDSKHELPPPLKK
jgi:hypothetical protein